MDSLSIEEKVAFLSTSRAYGFTGQVDVKQTHMSWIFLTPDFAWKLKKPVRYEHLDFSTPAARRVDCEEEIRLNRRLAPNVYLGVAPLFADRNDSCNLGRVGNLALDAVRQPIDWLVQMRRLPSDRLLDEAIRSRSWCDADLRKVARRLNAFYQTAEPIAMSAVEYREHLSDELIRSDRELSRPEYGLSRHFIQPVIDHNLELLQRRPELFDDRVHEGKVIEAHGDLRPEHIFLLDDPVIIDCLEFSRTLRTLDPASELTYLALECARLGAAEAGELILETYWSESADVVAPELLDFYRGYHAALRARIALWHIRDGETAQASKWINRCLEYLHVSSKSTIEPPE